MQAIRHILVVDDEPLVRQTIAMLLECEGHTVSTAASGFEGLSVFQPGRFHVVFTDFFMPSMTGYQLAQVIKLRAPTQPIVMITGFPEKIQHGRALIPWIDLLISKPFAFADLRAAVARFTTSQTLT
jgi:CheY-like chemotaxis protein